MSKIATILSGKGGTGKTMFATNMGASLALNSQKVLIIDMNFQSRGVDIALGLESRVIYDMMDVIKGNCRIKQALVKSREYPNLHILEPPALNKGIDVSLIELEVLIDRVKADFDYVIIDTSSAANAVSEGLAAKSDLVMVVTTQDPISVRAGQNLVNRLKKRGVEDTMLLVNQVKMKLTDKGYLTDVDEIAEAFGIEVCGVLPYDDSMHVAFNNGKPIVDISGSSAGEHLQKIIYRFTEE